MEKKKRKRKKEREKRLAHVHWLAFDNLTREGFSSVVTAHCLHVVNGHVGNGVQAVLRDKGDAGIAGLVIVANRH